MNRQRMKDIVEWLISIEEMARDLYADAAGFFTGDGDFGTFLKALSEDEEYHRTIMEKALQQLENGSAGMGTDIGLDENVKRNVETPLLESRHMLAAGTITADAMMGRIAAAEYSEWNTIFLYVADSMKDRGREFQHAASRIERHKTSIANRCGDQPSCSPVMEKIRTLPSLWKNRILIVDDNPATARFLAAVCGKLGIVDMAADGDDALIKSAENHYDLVISDIEMPRMDGIRYFNEAEKLDAGIGKRFLFFSGGLNTELAEYFRSRGLMYLEKPAQITAIYEAVGKILA